METIHLNDYLAVLKRRRKQILRVAASVFGIAVVLAAVLPTVYRSTAKLLIEQEVASDIVPSTVTGYVSQRIRVIQTRVLTSERLAQVAQKLDLYPSELKAGKTELVAERMRRNIVIESESAHVTDPKSGVSGMATVALNVSYESSDPQTAQKVAQELAALFIEENRAVRTQKAQRTTGFLGEEEARLREHIDDLEKQLAAYKEKNRGRLPELMNLNMQMFERTQKDLEEAERQIYSLEERKLQLQSQLALVEPYSGNSPGGRLREVQAQYMVASSTYSQEHPDVVRLKREMEMLQRQLGASGAADSSRAAIEAEYKRAKSEMAAAREKYGDDHPDIVRLKKTIASLESQLQKSSIAGAGIAVRPDNPTYVNLKTQLDSVELSLKAARDQQVRSRQLLSEYEQRLVQTPRVEQEGLALQREYESATKKYREIKQNLMGAELAVALEREQRGERYSVLVQAQVPGAPHRPNRGALLMIGLVLGIGSGVGWASLAEYMDRTVRGARGVAMVLGAAPLAVIPYIPNGLDGSLDRPQKV